MRDRACRVVRGERALGRVEAVRDALVHEAAELGVAGEHARVGVALRREVDGGLSVSPNQIVGREGGVGPLSDERVAKAVRARASSTLDRLDEVGRLELSKLIRGARAFTEHGAHPALVERRPEHARGSQGAARERGRSLEARLHDREHGVGEAVADALRVRPRELGDEQRVLPRARRDLRCAAARAEQLGGEALGRSARKPTERAPHRRRHPPRPRRVQVRAGEHREIEG